MTQPNRVEFEFAPTIGDYAPIVVQGLRKASGMQWRRGSSAKLVQYVKSHDEFRENWYSGSLEQVDNDGTIRFAVKTRNGDRMAADLPRRPGIEFAEIPVRRFEVLHKPIFQQFTVYLGDIDPTCQQTIIESAAAQCLNATSAKAVQTVCRERQNRAKLQQVSALVFTMHVHIYVKFVEGKVVYYRVDQEPTASTEDEVPASPGAEADGPTVPAADAAATGPAVPASGAGADVQIDAAPNAIAVAHETKQAFQAALATLQSAADKLLDGPNKMDLKPIQGMLSRQLIKLAPVDEMMQWYIDYLEDREREHECHFTLQMSCRRKDRSTDELTHNMILQILEAIGDATYNSLPSSISLPDFVASAAAACDILVARHNVTDLSKVGIYVQGMHMRVGIKNTSWTVFGTVNQTQFEGAATMAERYKSAFCAMMKSTNIPEVLTAEKQLNNPYNVGALLLRQLQQCTLADSTMAVTILQELMLPVWWAIPKHLGKRAGVAYDVCTKLFYVTVHDDTTPNGQLEIASSTTKMDMPSPGPATPTTLRVDIHAVIRKAALPLLSRKTIEDAFAASLKI